MKPYHIKSITEFHRLRGLPKPEHPLISIIDVTSIQHLPSSEYESMIFDFYSISLKRNCRSKFRYGQQQYDFDEGTMFFIAPGQIFGIEYHADEGEKRTGWMMLIHPDFLWHTALAKTIKKYEFFNYSVHEALFLSEKEETILNNIARNIEQEYHSNIDKFSQDVIIAQLELLLTYSERFYERQFLTRKISNHKILDRLEEILADYFNSDDLISKGLPTVQNISGLLNVSPNYLSSLLKVLTGQSTQHHIHNKLIEKAKEKLSTTELSISEIAYELGFEHSQSFSKFFKTKTNYSPSEFRTSFN
ncbi:MAG TPA: AraC family transcriptional regulator [Arachidicoccus soli]|uniref:AraC family transcriptional regulator n=1 Tax=Arachidicoccus soli TaxID=2341117 RepID=A0A386HRU6_9BACT|nr:AraC family transcriptional regulator [Arachidicoccus soli]AYD48161.1 AraC family transcriptional regulator [Arachidicoccus soli]HEU0227934.1 AraC family transcriptional regulator [Arachidicoccus soli]